MEHQRMWGRYPRLGLRGKISRKSRLLPCQSRGFLRHFTSIQFLDMKSLTGQINRELIMLDWHFMGVGKKRCNTLDGLPIEMTNVCRFHGPTKKCFDVLWPPTEHQIIIPSVKYKEIWATKREAMAWGWFHLANTNNAEAWEVAITHIHPLKYGTFDL
jgi:hypothetical protein